jgi:hypothetical protein
MHGSRCVIDGTLGLLGVKQFQSARRMIQTIVIADVSGLGCHDRVQQILLCRTNLYLPRMERDVHLMKMWLLQRGITLSFFTKTHYLIK